MYTKKEIYCLIRHYEYHQGEDFIDYNESIINKFNMLFWLLGKGYLTTEKSSWWCRHTAELIDLNYLFLNNDNSVFKETDELADLKKNYILSEVIEGNVLLENRLIKSLLAINLQNINDLLNNSDSFIEEFNMFENYSNILNEEVPGDKL
jgi:hypothetical protein